MRLKEFLKAAVGVPKNAIIIIDTNGKIDGLFGIEKVSGLRVSYITGDSLDDSPVFIIKATRGTKK